MLEVHDAEDLEDLAIWDAFKRPVKLYWLERLFFIKRMESIKRACSKWTAK